MEKQEPLPSLKNILVLFYEDGDDLNASILIQALKLTEYELIIEFNFSNKINDYQILNDILQKFYTKVLYIFMKKLKKHLKKPPLFNQQS